MDIRFYRSDEIGREARNLPAHQYNLIHLMFTRTDGGHLFVPIRSMQYLAAIDKEEIIFVDGTAPRNIELTWCEFRSGEREDLRAPVAYTCIYYKENARQIMNRLQTEFYKALELMQSRQAGSKGATVTALEESRNR